MYDIPETPVSYRFPAIDGSTSGSLYVDHTQDGSKQIDVQVKTNLGTSTQITKAERWTLDQIPRQANITNGADFTDNSNPSITYVNPAGTAVTSLQCCIKSGSTTIAQYRTLSNSGNSFTFDLTSEEVDRFRNLTATSASVPINYVLKTTIGGVEMTSQYEATFTIEPSEDTIPTLVETHSPTSSLPHSFDNLYIQNKTKMQCSLQAVAKYGATIASYTTRIGQTTYDTSEFTSEFLQTSGTIPISFTVTDTRGFTNTISGSVEVKPYQPPQL